ncbi:hypothetical protein DACRYDRAFT_25437 [Dacryopinax primogenitus]|uniref:Uncharacterized protein n=1 Tax=Dacryopinax primogenitus (strain DJM 731) TaxID=1858805 RepID=M5FN90_DACPD|nr:uncharacterized protein DACRYDRAFT_25437 [Dacryopinax primogenitus]EJT97030.1 hypothetical protein DACRYDRAFT_25437 [Dacryopinax primogenitus]
MNTGLHTFGLRLDTNVFTPLWGGMRFVSLHLCGLRGDPGSLSALLALGRLCYPPSMSCSFKVTILKAIVKANEAGWFCASSLLSVIYLRSVQNAGFTSVLSWFS